MTPLSFEPSFPYLLTSAKGILLEKSSIATRFWKQPLATDLFAHLLTPAKALFAALRHDGTALVHFRGIACEHTALVLEEEENQKRLAFLFLPTLQYGTFCSELFAKKEKLYRFAAIARPLLFTAPHASKSNAFRAAFDLSHTMRSWLEIQSMQENVLYADAYRFFADCLFPVLHTRMPNASLQLDPHLSEHDLAFPFQDFVPLLLQAILWAAKHGDFHLHVAPYGQDLQLTLRVSLPQEAFHPLENALLEWHCPENAQIELTFQNQAPSHALVMRVPAVCSGKAVLRSPVSVSELQDLQFSLQKILTYCNGEGTCCNASSMT